MSRRYEFDAAGGTPSFRWTGRGKPTPAFCQAMQYLAAAAIAHQGILDRAYDPRVGDRFIGRDGTSSSTVIAVDPLEGITDADFGPGHSRIISYTTSLTGPRIHQALLCDWETLAANAIEGGHTFHPVEDDEE